MPFSITYSSSNNDQLLRSIAGAYFKQQRLSKDLSLIEASKALHLNKGFLSDLEHGNRHFPEGIINQLNSYYSCNFDESISLRENAEKMGSSNIEMGKKWYENIIFSFIYAIISMKVIY